jgi:hypothetical protein
MYLSAPRNEDGDVPSSLCMHDPGDLYLSLVIVPRFVSILYLI